ncbi:MAG: glycosyltransferase [Phycisphaerales bacterium]
MKRVFLCAGDESGWAIDEDRRLTAAALDGVARLVERPDEAEVIHSCWWEPLMRLPREAVAGKPVVCQMAGDPARVMAEPAFIGAMSRVTQWVAQSRHGWERMRVLSAGAALVPYAVDPTPFLGENGPDDPRVARARAELSRARSARERGAYVVASFHRDTAGPQVSPAMDIPKLVKGPDVLVEVLAGLRERGVPVVALLAGPRRQWVRARLAERGVPVVYAGDERAGDDYPGNTLPREQLARLYALADVCVSTSRSEGGPRGILEAAAAGVAQLATRTGLAAEVLHPDAVVDDAAKAIERLCADLAGGVLRRLAPAARALVRSAYTVEANRARWAEVYRGLDAGHGSGAVGRPAIRLGGTSVATVNPTAEGAARGMAVPARPARAGRVAFWNKFTTGPWGGGNQFMTALMAEAGRAGVRTSANGEPGDAPGDAGGFAGHVVNSVQFDLERFEAMVKPGEARVVHRIDGPISVLRGTPDSMEQDRRCFEFNRKHATATVIQSWHTVRALAELGFEPVRPVLVLNAADPAIFHPPPVPREPGARLRIVASAWSPSPGKGAAIYEWMDRNLDPSQYEFTFVGNTPATLRHARAVKPLPSAELAALLREQDVYITASRNDPCSNALIEALACGLPALYYDSGGHPELTGFGGLPFRRPEEIPPLLERLREHHAMYRRLIAVPTLASVTRRYMDLIFGDEAYRSER